MKANTAFCFLLSGVVLIRLASNLNQSRRDRGNALLIIGIVTVAFLSLLEYSLHRNLGIDELLTGDTTSLANGHPPGRMSIASSASFLCFSAALALIDFSMPSAAFCIAGLLISFVVLVGLLYRTAALYSVGVFSTFSLPTAVGFCVLGLAGLMLRPKRMVAPLVNSAYAEVAMTRPLLAGAVLFPPCFGLLCLEGQRLGWYPAEFTLSLLTVALMFGSSMLLWWTSRIGSAVEEKRQHAEARLKSRTEELKKSNAALEQYAHAAAHDLQEPLRIIAIYAELLARISRQKLSVEEQECLAVLRSSAQRMSSLVSDLRLHSRILADEQIAFAPIDMNKVLREIVVNDKAAFRDAEVSIKQLPTVYGDQTQLVILFRNLLENSLKYRKPTVPPRIEISATSDGAYGVFSVADRGIGFEMDYAERIFGVFKRLHGQEIPGTGMGLAICQRVVEKHRGQIWAESQPGVGATFYVALPVVSKTEDELEELAELQLG